MAAFKHRSSPFGVRFLMGKKKARRNAEGLNDDKDDISRAWDDLEQLRLVVIKLEQASHKLTAHLHQTTLELQDVRAERDGLQADIQRLRESNQVCLCRRQRPVVHIHGLASHKRRRSVQKTPCRSRAHMQALAPNASWQTWRAQA